MNRCTAALIIALPSAVSAVQGAVAQAPTDTVRQLARAAAEVRHLGRVYGDSVWPGYHPDSIPILFVLPRRGFLLTAWSSPLPTGFEAVPGVPEVAWSDSSHESAASTSELLSGTSVAQVSVSSMDPDYLVPTAFHEAFHAFERASRRSDSWFGETENAYFVASYPIFDVSNEAAFALEGRILATATTAPSTQQRRQLAREFVAVREDRLSRLDPEYAEFDRASELNEGLAEYALVRALGLIDAHGPAEWRAGARQRLAERGPALAALTRDGQSSFRIRYYRTGPAIATLLDALAPMAWKHDIMSRRETLDGALAAASGFDSAARAWRHAADIRFDASGLRTAAARDVAALEAVRASQVDSILSRRGVQLIIGADSLPARDFNICGLDPQNVLQVTTATQLHTRWVHPCAGKSLDADFNIATIHSDSAGTFRSVLSPADSVRVTAGGAPVSLATLHQPAALTDLVITAPHVRVASSRAVIAVTGDTLRLEPLP
jgi:hypothetical protein